jgi:hypothetical protein
MIVRHPIRNRVTSPWLQAERQQTDILGDLLSRIRVKLLAATPASGRHR